MYSISSAALSSDGKSRVNTCKRNFSSMRDHYASTPTNGVVNRRRPFPLHGQKQSWGGWTVALLHVLEYLRCTAHRFANGVFRKIIIILFRSFWYYHTYYAQYIIRSPRTRLGWRLYSETVYLFIIIYSSQHTFSYCLHATVVVFCNIYILLSKNIPSTDNINGYICTHTAIHLQ